MKILLDPPFKEKYKNGYLVVNKENRKNVVLYNSKIDRTTISYARYLYSVHLGEEVKKNLEVDHIDNDKTNDVLSNLQLLSKQKNKIKEGLRRRKNQHGTLAMYRYCKCDLCKSAKSNHNKLMRKQ